MLLGHYGVAFAAKRVAPRTSLGLLTFAAEFLDELWPILILMGVEHVRVVPGLMAANPLDFVYYPISHSLAMAAVWSVLIGGICYVRRRNRGPALVVGLVVLSHWFLDVPMHRADLQLWPGWEARVGLGAWRSIPLTIALEAIVFVPGLVIYLRTTRARDRIGTWALCGMVLVLVAIFASGFAPVKPAPERTIGMQALGLWLFVPWAWWIDRHREVVVGGTVRSL